MRSMMMALTMAALTACSSGAVPEGDAPQQARDARDVREAIVTGPDLLTAEGWGPLRVGMTRAEVTEALGPADEPDGIPVLDPSVCDFYHPQRAPEGLIVMLENDRLARVTLIDSGEVKTEGGLAPGAPASAVRDHFGNRAVALPHHYEAAPAEDIYVWTTPRAATAYVEDSAARGLRYEIGSDGNIVAIHVGGPAIQYVEGCL